MGELVAEDVVDDEALAELHLVRLRIPVGVRVGAAAGQPAPPDGRHQRHAGVIHAIAREVRGVEVVHVTEVVVGEVGVGDPARGSSLDADVGAGARGPVTHVGPVADPPVQGGHRLAEPERDATSLGVDGHEVEHRGPVRRAHLGPPHEAWQADAWPAEQRRVVDRERGLRGLDIRLRQAVRLRGRRDRLGSGLGRRDLGDDVERELGRHLAGHGEHGTARIELHRELAGDHRDALVQLVEADDRQAVDGLPHRACPELRDRIGEAEQRAVRREEGASSGQRVRLRAGGLDGLCGAAAEEADPSGLGVIRDPRRIELLDQPRVRAWRGGGLGGRCLRRGRETRDQCHGSEDGGDGLAHLRGPSPSPGDRPLHRAVLRRRWWIGFASGSARSRRPGLGPRVVAIHRRNPRCRNRQWRGSNGTQPGPRPTSNACTP